MDEFDANTTPYDETGDSQHPAGPSRRSFLKAAVVGSAAVVAASGAGAATLALTGHHTGLKKYVPFIGDATLSGVTSDACTTDSSDSPQSDFGSDSIYFWAKFNDLPAGPYTIGVTPTIDPQGTNWSSGLSGLAFNSASNCANVYVLDASKATYTCNPPSLPNPGDTPYSQNTLPINFSAADGQDALFQLHIKAEKGFTGTVTITATLYTGNAVNSANKVDYASAQITIS